MADMNPEERLYYILNGIKAVKGRDEEFSKLKPLTQNLFNDLEWAARELQRAWDKLVDAKVFHARLKGLVDTNEDIDPEIVRLVDDEFWSLL